ncbi:MAG: hypothetical protein WC977_10910 [Anaerovoracaceae bacterium]
MAPTTQGKRLTEGHRIAQLTLSAEVARKVAALWPLMAAGDDATAWVEAVIRLLMDEFQVSAAVARQYYTQFREAETGEPPPFVDFPVVEPQPEVMRVGLISHGPFVLAKQLKMGKLWEIAQQRARADASAEAIRLAAEGGRQQILESIKKDSGSLGWARVVGGKPCAFCAMLASRGPAYKGRSSATFQAHPSCGCTAEPVFSRSQPWPEGSEKFKQIYETAKRTAKEEDGNVTNVFRRMVESPRDGA